MKQNQSTFKHQSIDPVIHKLDKLKNYAGPPSEFWPEYIAECGRLVEADIGVLLVKEKSDTSFKTLCIWPTGNRTLLTNNAEFSLKIEAVAEAALLDGFAWEQLSTGKKGTLVSVNLDTKDKTNYDSVAVFNLPKSSSMSPQETVTRLKLVADIPSMYLLRLETDKARTDVIQFSQALDLMVLMNEESKYLSACMTFVNEIASRFGCSRVSLGWLKNGYIRIQAVSHMEQFEKKMDAVQILETAMEESFDQDEEILFPAHPGARYVFRQHEQFSKEQGAPNMVSLPIRIGDTIHGILNCERSDRPFSENDINGLRLFCDQSARRLFDLKKHDRWFGALAMEALREKSSGILGFEHTLLKALGILICILLCVLFFGKIDYRVEAPFILKTDDVAYLPAPFDGYIKQVHIKPGDTVKENQLLLTLDTQELLLEESSAIADKTRYLRESEKARAKYALAEMRIANALKVQAEARLELIRYHLSNAKIKAPFTGVVVEGDLKEMLGAPVRKGDVLFKSARIKPFYAELDLDEKDIHDILTDSKGEIAFVSLPDKKFPISVKIIEPAAVPGEKGNVFKVRCDFPDPPKNWWRPGMSGISKINVGKRNIFWIISHRTVDFLRLFLWW